MEQLLQRFKALKVELLIKKILTKEKERIKNLLTNQIYSGIDGKNEGIKPVYSNQYKIYKEKRGLYQGWVDLHLSGDYLKNYVAEITNDALIVTGEDYVTDGFRLGKHLKENYGSDIEEFTEKSLDIIYGIIGEELINEIKAQLQVL